MRRLRMTKEEFLKTVETELSNLEIERTRALGLLAVLEKGYSSYNSVNEGKQRLEMVDKKIQLLKDLLQYPAYARVKAASDVEMEEYRKSKIAELDDKIKDIGDKLKQFDKKLEELEKEEEELILKISTLTGQKKDETIKRVLKLRAEKSNYDLNYQNGFVVKLNHELEQIKKQREKIKSKDVEELKHDFLIEVTKISEGKIDEFEKRELYSSSLDETRKMFLAISNDPRKTVNMAQLLVEYAELNLEVEKVRMYFKKGIPNAIKDKFLEYCGDSYTDAVSKKDIDTLMKIIEDYEEQYKEEKDKFTKQFTEEKLLKLVEYKKSINGTSIDVDFFRLHMDKIDFSKVEEIQNLIEKRNNLYKKSSELDNRFFKRVFKRGDNAEEIRIKEEISDLEVEIITRQVELYKIIKNWYESQNNSILNFNANISFYSQDDVVYYLKDAKKSMNQTEERILDIKEQIEDAKKNLKEEQERKKEKIEELAKKIRAEAGPEFEKANTPIEHFSGNFVYNVDKILYSSYMDKEKGMIDSVKKEAQNQADIKEAELKGITIEELQKLKQQLSQTDKGMNRKEEINPEIEQGGRSK